MHRNIVNETKRCGGKRSGTISIAMATYNGEKFLPEQLQSFLDQSCLPNELVVSDDASTDNTMEILRNYAESAPFEVKIFQNKVNVGYAKNFENALIHCSSEIIFLSDQDDIWNNQKIETISMAFGNNPFAWSITNDQEIADGELRPSGITKMENIRSVGLPISAMITGCCTCIRKELRDIALPIPFEQISHDGWINGLADVIGVRVMVEESLQLYRRHGQNASDWQMSRTEKPSRFDGFRRFGLQDAREGWARELRRLEVMHSRIASRADIFAARGVPECKKQAALLKLERKRNALVRRSEIVSKDRLRRVPSVISFYLRGGYSEFDGAKSAIKDVIRR